MEAKPWGQGMHLPNAPRDESPLRPDADSIVQLSEIESRQVMNRLSTIAAQLGCEEIVLPATVDSASVSALVKQWNSDGRVTVGRTSQGEILVRSHPSVDQQGGHFARISSNFLVVSAGPIPAPPDGSRVA
jgi:hypothetical protein